MFGIGYSKFAPGTVASLITTLSFYLLFKIGYLEIRGLHLIYIVIVIFFLGILVIDKFSSFFKEVDAQEIVIDEFLAVYLILIFYDYYAFSNTIINLFLIFIFFRFFDMTKTFPANIVDKKIKNSLGVIFNDIIDAIYTITLMIILNAFIA